MIFKKKKNKYRKFQNISFKSLEKRINKNLKKKEKNIKSNLDTFMNKTYLKKNNEKYKFIRFR